MRGKNQGAYLQKIIITPSYEKMTNEEDAFTNASFGPIPFGPFITNFVRRWGVFRYKLGPLHLLSQSALLVRTSSLAVCVRAWVRRYVRSSQSRAAVTTVSLHFLPLLFVPSSCSLPRPLKRLLKRLPFFHHLSAPPAAFVAPCLVSGVVFLLGTLRKKPLRPGFVFCFSVSFFECQF